MSLKEENRKDVVPKIPPTEKFIQQLTELAKSQLGL